MCKNFTQELKEESRGSNFSHALIYLRLEFIVTTRLLDRIKNKEIKH
jgi:hypothetical protein